MLESWEKSLEFTPTQWIVKGRNLGIRVQETTEDKAAFGWWRNPTKADSWWQDEGAVSISFVQAYSNQNKDEWHTLTRFKGQWLAPGISKAQHYSTKAEIDKHMTTKYQHPSTKFYTLDFDAMDKMLGCNSDIREAQFHDAQAN